MRTYDLRLGMVNVHRVEPLIFAGGHCWVPREGYAALYPDAWAAVANMQTMPEGVEAVDLEGNLVTT